ncbi:hypothetical protein EV356DRAFT_499327 [Viridothelium virens]|uniref:Uncharacterized protein n=1 Tax=Viridothelium virens TaxID=1048519 RepID=A0A6A6HCD5_VIRVR|nr:hypothetical protein EV356DRAFT_499327 [Viridothelium virens]
MLEERALVLDRLLVLLGLVLFGFSARGYWLLPLPEVKGLPIMTNHRIGIGNRRRKFQKITT